MNMLCVCLFLAYFDATNHRRFILISFDPAIYRSSFFIILFYGLIIENIQRFSSDISFELKNNLSGVGNRCYLAMASVNSR